MYNFLYLVLKMVHSAIFICLFLFQKHNEGPSYWIENYPVGNHQSPINIETKNAVYDSNLANKPLKLNFDKKCFTKIENTGTSFQVSGSDKAISSKKDNLNSLKNICLVFILFF
jgi:hypothetical protein